MPKTPLSFYLHIIAVAVIVFAVGNYVSSRTPDRAEGSPSIISGDSSSASGLTRNDNQESVYDRVMRTGVIRCGYTLWHPSVIKDPNTGLLSGIFYDYTNKLGEYLGLKIEWVEELGLGDFPAALESGRIDAMCSSIWAVSARARNHDFVKPIYYLPMYFFARNTDARITKDWQKLDDVNFTMAVLEGGATSMLHRQFFSNAKKTELPQLTSPAELFITLSQGKADFVIYDLFTFNDFNKHNPDKIRLVSPQPFKVFDSAIAIKRGEYELQRMLSHSTNELLQSGVIETIIEKYETYPNTMFRVATPYQLPANKN